MESLQRRIKLIKIIFLPRLCIMEQVLVLWDAREANDALIRFIDELDETLCLYQVRPTFLQIDHEHLPQSGKIKFSMKGLLQQIHHLQPDMVLCFGSEASLLGKLIRPALKSQLISNYLPSYLDPTRPNHSTIHSLTKRLSEFKNWDYKSNKYDYLYYPLIDGIQTKTGIALIEEDPMFHALTQRLQFNQLDMAFFSLSQLAKYDESSLNSCGLLVMSSELEEASLLTDIANAKGLNVLYISKHGNNAIRDGVNGWVVDSIYDPRIIVKLKNWQKMGKDPRSVLSYYARQHQSRRSGIHSFCLSIGLLPAQYQIKNNKSVNFA